VEREKTGVILLNLGGPDSQKAVRPFLYNLFSDREIIRLGPSFMQKPLAWLISMNRAPKTRGFYRLIGGASPIRDITSGQAEALGERLKAHGEFEVFMGMRYWKPFIKDAVARAHAGGIKRLIALSLYPQYSVATTGSSERALREALRNNPMECESIQQWYNHPLYIDALAEVVGEALREDTVVLFSAHSLPESFIKEGDPYVDHTMGTIEALTSWLGIKDWRLGYQSRSGPVKWLGPSTDEVLRQLAGQGARDVLVVPVSFVSDHIETLYEIDILYRRMAEELGMTLRRAESLNTRPRFIDALEDMVVGRARQKGWL